MGKIRIRKLGIEEIEEKQKKEAKKRSKRKKKQEDKVKAPGGKGGERMKQVSVEEEELAKMKKAEKIIEEPADKGEKKESQRKRKKPRKKKIHVRGKNYQKAKGKVKEGKGYELKEAVELLKKISYADFDETVELHVNTKENGIRGKVQFPHPIGRDLKVKVADEEAVTQIKKGKIDFDILVSHPKFMPKLVKVAKILGPKGLMPNSKAGTISKNPEETAKKLLSGLIRFKTEPKFPIIHQAVGNLSHKEKNLIENIETFIEALPKNKIKSVYIKSTMSPSLRLDLEKMLDVKGQET